MPTRAGSISTTARPSTRRWPTSPSASSCYLRGFRRGQFAEAADAILSRTFAAQQLAPLRPRIERLHAAYRDVGPGDRYALTYRPGVGTELALNGEPLVVVPGADFAAAYFAIWLGPEPADQRFRDDLLRRP